MATTTPPPPPVPTGAPAPGTGLLERIRDAFYAATGTPAAPAMTTPKVTTAPRPRPSSVRQVHFRDTSPPPGTRPPPHGPVPSGLPRAVSADTVLPSSFGPSAGYPPPPPLWHGRVPGPTSTFTPYHPPTEVPFDEASYWGRGASQAPPSPVVASMVTSVDITKPPCWSSFNVTATRQFVLDEARYHTEVRSQRRQPRPFYSYISTPVLSELPAFCRRVLGVELANPLTIPASELPEWEACVRHAIDRYITIPSHTAAVSVDERFRALTRAMTDSWDRHETSYLAAFFNFESHWSAHLIEGGDTVRTLYYSSKRSEKRVVQVLLGCLHPPLWASDMQARAEHEDDFRLDRFWDRLRDQEDNWRGFRVSHSDHNSHTARPRPRVLSGATASPSRVPSRPCKWCASPAHYDRDCTSRAPSTSSSRPLSRNCRHCNGPHLDSLCPTKSSSSPTARPVGVGRGRPGDFRGPAVRAVTFSSRPASSAPAPPSALRQDRLRGTSAPAGAGGPATGLPPSPCKFCASPAHFNRDCPTQPRSASGHAAGAGRGGGGRGFHRIRRVGAPDPSAPSDGLITVNSVSVPYCLDSGATASIMGRPQALQLAGGLLEALTPLPTPVLARTAAVGASLSLTATLYLPTATFTGRSGATATLHHVKFWVADNLDGTDALVSPSDITLPPELWDLRLPSAPSAVPTVDDDDDLPALIPARTHVSSYVPTASSYVRRAVALDTAESDEDDPLDDDNGVDYSAHEPEEVRAALLQSLARARAAGLSVEASNRLAHFVLGEAFHVFRLSVGQDPPASVPAASPTVDQSSPPPKPGMRKMDREALEYLRLTVNEMVANGILTPAHNSVWGSPAYAVRKPGTTADTPLLRRFRPVIDYRAVNDITRPNVDTVPRVEVATEMLGGKSHIGTADMVAGFTQMLLGGPSAHCFVIVTPFGAFQPVRMPMGLKDGPGCFQSAVHHALRDLTLPGGDLTAYAVTQYIDDLDIVATSADELVLHWMLVINRLDHFGFKLHPLKVVFYSPSVDFLGRTFSADGISFNSAAVHAISTLPRPRTAQELGSFVATANWFRTAIPAYALLVDPLHALHKAALVGLRPTRAARERRDLADLWTSAHDDAFNAIVSAITNSTKLAHPDPTWSTCVFTDASRTGWAGVITQRHPDDADLPILQQRHRPLAFYSGAFRGAQLNYAILDQEAYAVISTLDKGAYLLLGRPRFTLYVDNQVLSFIFSANPATAASNRQIADRLARWVVRLRAYSYDVVHIPGDTNVTADMLSRWQGPATPASAAQVLARVVTRLQRTAALSAPAPASPSPAPAPPASVPLDTGPAGAGSASPAPPPSPQRVAVAPLPHDVDFGPSEQLRFTPMDDAPTQTEIVAAQHSAPASSRAKSARLNADGVWVSATGAMWIPDVNHLRLRLLVCAHASMGGHHGVDTTLARLQAYAFWDGMHAHTRTFVTGCLHCVRCRGGHVIPRPLGHQVRAQHVNHWVSADFLYVSAPGVTPCGSQYIHVIVDQFSKFVQLTCHPAATSDAAAQALLQWAANFGTCRRLLTDGGAHYTAQLIAALCGLYGMDQHICTAYNPHSNGLVERTNKTVLFHLRSICSEARLTVEHWPRVIHLIQGLINSAPCRALGGLAPITVHTGLPADNPVQAIFLPDDRDFLDTTALRPSITAHATALHEFLQDVHTRVAAVPPRPSPTRPGELAINFTVGDFVLVSAHHGVTSRRDKSQVPWLGPYRITDTVSERVFVVQDLELGTEQRVHAQHLKFYSDSSLTVTPQVLKFAAHAGLGHVVTDIVAHTLDPLQVQVQWLGYSPDEATWEPLSTILATNPRDVRRYCNSLRDRASREALQLSIDRLAPPVSD